MTDREIMQQALKMIRSLRYRSLTDVSDEIISALEKRLAQPEQGPVACQYAKDVAMPEYKCAGKCQYAQPEQEPVLDERIESVRHMRDVQGYDGNWNYDPYMQGLYNGLEFALSLLEVRQPEFKDAPATWLGDIKFKRDKLSSGAAHGIKENT